MIEQSNDKEKETNDRNRMASDQAGEYVNEHYRKVAARWRARVTDSPFMQQLRAGTLAGGDASDIFQKLGFVHHRDQHGGGGIVP